jgi:hypothetical protein
VSPTFSFTTANLICRSPALAIPDGSAAGINDNFVVADAGTLTGLKLVIKATHTYVGDLKFTLSKAPGTSIVIDRPGYTGSGFGCSGDNVDVVIDDGSGVLVESQCNASPPALSGNVKPNNPLAAAFMGQPLAGTWTLNVSDNAGSDTGTLDQWCLLPATGGGPTTYTVGGSVSGLTGAGLVLSLNAGAQTLPVAASGAFTFPIGLADSSPYAVTVGTQPAGQTCSVSNGSGTISGANVTNVSVTCTGGATFTVGGNVSGLSGAGLVLSLNSGSQTLPVAANGSFTFPVALANGTGYNVTVGTQPAGQTCAVASGSGVISGANVTSVAVTCAASTFTVGGNVSGLVGTGLVLSLNSGAQSLPIAANGSFTFPTPVADGSMYAVTVSTQPTNPPAVCTVTNGSGTVAGGNVVTVGVTCIDRIFADGFDGT